MPRVGLFFIDWDCGFCHRSRAWILRHTPSGRVLSGGLGSLAADHWLRACGLDPGRRDTVVHVDVRKGRVRCATHSTAIVRAMRGLRWPYRALVVVWLVPRPLRDWGYRWVARNRYRL